MSMNVRHEPCDFFKLDSNNQRCIRREDMECRRRNKGHISYTQILLNETFVLFMLVPICSSIFHISCSYTSMVITDFLKVYSNILLLVTFLVFLFIILTSTCCCRFKFSVISKKTLTVTFSIQRIANFYSVLIFSRMRPLPFIEKIKVNQRF